IALRDCLPMPESQSAHEFLASYMNRTVDSTGTGYMMRSKDYDKVGGIDTSFEKLLFADYALWIDLTRLRYKATSPAFAFKYRIHDSVSKITGGQEYQQAFEKFLKFIKKLSEKDKQIKLVVEKYGKDFLLYFCESLSHRLLKTPRNERTIVVKEFVEKCKYYASILIPGQSFAPEKKFRIKIAEILDTSSLGRELFFVLKKLHFS
ncbi:MAG: hypothetical protein ACRDE5_10145, partial [Ginsengibacter sp.]